MSNYASSNYTEKAEPSVTRSYESKHISEVKKGDVLLISGEHVCAASDAYMVKTDYGKEWNFEDKRGEYIYASDIEAGIVAVVSSANEMC